MPGESNFNMESALADISSGLGFGSEGGDDGGLGGEDSLGGGLDAGTGDGTDSLAGTGGEDTIAGGDNDTVAGGGSADPKGGEPTTPAPGPDRAPNQWRPEAQAKWATLDPVIKSEILKREDDMFKGIESYKADAGFGKEVKDILQPYMQYIEAAGSKATDQIRGLMRAHATLAMGTPEQKSLLFKQLASHYGVKLEPDVPEGEQPYVDPAVKSLHERLAKIESTEAEQRAAAQQELQAKVKRDIDTFFADEKAHPYAKEVWSDMAALMKGGGATSLKDAYEKAVWANPVTRAKEQSRLTAEAAAKAQKEAADKALAARKAMSANVRSTPKSGRAAAPLGSMDDTIAATLKEIQARGS